MVYFLLAGVILLIVVRIRIHDFLTGSRLIQEFLDELTLSTQTLIAGDAFWARNPNRSDVIVCLTTIPSRVAHIEDTLKSLLYQSRSPQSIRLHIPTFSKRERCAYTLPPCLEALRAVEIVRCKDYGPATKLIPALQDLEPDQRVLLVDDDRLYPSSVVDDFFRWSNECPDVAIGAAGWIVPEDLMDSPVPLLDYLREIPPARIRSTRIRKRKRVDIIEGYAGHLVRPRFFDVARITDYSRAPKAAFFVDDVWISAHCTVPKYIFPARRHGFNSKRHRRVFRGTALWRINGGDPDENNVTVMIRHFEDRWSYLK